MSVRRFILPSGGLAFFMNYSKKRIKANQVLDFVGDLQYHVNIIILI